jgi:diaminopimelate epimerase
MRIQFSKYHGTGNDFVVIDGRKQDTSDFDADLIRQMCDRRFGIGGDGLIILEESERADFKMAFFNSNGKEGTMCGNGGRCITAFASKLGIISMDTTFEGTDGLHAASILPNEEIRLGLSDVDGIRWMEDGYLLDTGSPHFVQFVSQLEMIDVTGVGRNIRNQPRFGKDGVNVNFVERSGSPNMISVRTYERGVENETSSCGTGVAAAAICAYFHYKSDILSYHVGTPGGNLHVSFKPRYHNQFSDIYLTGPAAHVFDGSIEITL